jgi:hypothetical protein
MISKCRYRFLGFSLLLAACTEEHRISLGGDGGTDAETDQVDASTWPTECENGPDELLDVLPDSLACTGLYESLADKRVAESALSFEPAFPLWSDGAEKHRWISLPEGTQIDNSQPNEWVFPVGTKLWKEFRVGGKRIETRIFWKTASDVWIRGTYAWNADESAAELSFGGNIKIADGQYYLPKSGDCTDCHKGQPDFVLGFSAVNLGLKGASGITLADLVEQGLLTEEPPLSELSIGADELGLDDDGNPLTAQVLGTLHTNCGLTCHNDTPNAKASLTSQNLRLDMTLLDGRSPDETFNVLRTAVGQRAEGVQWSGRPFRIVPGDPQSSLIFQLMSHRDPTGMGQGQMPPIATSKVDTQAVKLIEEWIKRLAARLPPAEDAGAAPEDAGTTPDPGMDAGMQNPEMDAASEVDAGSPPVDAGSADLDTGTDGGVDAQASDVDAQASDPEAGVDAGVPDAGSDAGDGADAAPDAGAPDAGAPDADAPEAGI